MDKEKYLSKENVESIQELSFLQKEMFREFESKEEENGTGNVHWMSFAVNGSPDLNNIQGAWEQVVRQTPLLRTVFRKARNRTLQVVLKEYPTPLEIFGPDPQENDKPVDLQLQDHREQSASFNLAEAPSVKAKLFRLDDETAIILLICHRIILDKKSLMCVFEDIMSLYTNDTNRLTGEDGPSGKRVPFKDYLDWLNRQYWFPAIAYWKREFADFSSPTSLVSYQRFGDRAVGSFRPQQLLLTEEQSGDLAAFCRQEDVSPSILVQAAWALLLHLYSGEKDVYFGGELRGKPEDAAGFQTTIGPFANILPFHVSLDLTQTVRELMAELKKKNEDAGRYSYLSPGEIHSHIDPPPGTRLFESSVSVGEPLDLHPGDMDYGQTHSHPFALEVFIGKQWRLNLFCFNGGLPGSAAMEVLKRLETLLEEIKKGPAARRLLQLDYLSAADAEKLAAFNQPDINVPDRSLERFVHQVFEEQVEKKPTAAACTWRGKHPVHITYRELNRRANRLAHWLREQGVGAGDLVGIFSRRGIDMLIAILAVFKAGGAYIPLDPASPDARIKTIIIDSKVKVVLTGAPEAGRTRQLVDDSSVSAPVFCLEPIPGEKDFPNTLWLENYPTENLPVVNSPWDPSYVIFTSGSTGVPKGVVVEHLGMLNHLWTKVRLLGLSDTSKVVQNASHCFDISVWQFLAAFMKGGQTVIYDDEVAMSPWLLLQALGKDRVTVLEMVPSVIEMVLREGAGNGSSNETALPDTRYMLSTGEALPTALCREWMERYPHMTVVNAYGPTECSDDTHHQVVSAGNPPQEYYNQVPIGRIIPNFRGYILDEAMRPLPPGCPGEIYLTGIGVGKGYLNDPERTADAFMKNPFHDGIGTCGNRMYRSGDLGYFDPEGQLVFLGRVDHQVKVRGFRIELEEIEVRLREHPAVKQCVVVTYKDSNDHNQIAAYVVPGGEGGEPLSLSRLRTYLEELLPAYMVPAHFLELEKLPLTPSGKIDRRALPPPGQVTESTGPPELPGTPLEETLVRIWEEVLEISPIGVNHNFFQLGGHSLRVIQVRSRIKQLLGVDISIARLFQMQTVRQLAEFIEEQERQTAVQSPRKPPITRVPRSSHYPMSHAQQRLFFVHQVEPDNTAYNLPTVVEIGESLQMEAFERALQEVTRRQASLRSTFGLMDNKPVQFIADENHKIQLTFEDLSHFDAVQRERIKDKRLKEEARFRFDLTREPLFYTIVFKLEERRFLIFFNMHHIVGDLWSWDILFKELFVLYQGYKEEKEVPLPELNVQYADYAAWQNQCIENGSFQVHADYWKGQLSGEPPVLELPLDFPRPLTREYRAGRAGKRIPGTYLEGLFRFFQEKDVTLFIGLLSLFYAFLSRITGQTDIVIGTPEAGRNQVEVENLIGFFVNTLPLRVDLGGDPTFPEIVDRVKQVSLESYEHAEYPFDLIVKQLALTRDLGRYPLFSLLFLVVDMNDKWEEEKRTSELSIRSYDVPTNSANYDLQVTFIDLHGDFQCSFLYREDLFREETIERWIDHFIVFVKSAADSPGARLSTISMLTPQQKEQFLYTFNASRRDYPKNKTLHGLFEEQVDKTPHGIALVAPGRGTAPGEEGAVRDDGDMAHLTYRELNNRSNRLAHLLKKKGLKTGNIVGIMVERSLEMLIGLIGIMKAGGAYLPIEPDYPEERKRYMLADSASKVLVTTQALSKDIKLDKEIIYLSDAIDRVPAPLPPHPSPAAANSCPAYVIYTSGSTGKPKGVLVEHASVVNILFALQQRYPLTTGDTYLFKTSYLFDVSVTELFGWYMGGSSLSVLAPGGEKDPQRIIETIESDSVTHINFVPSMFGVFLEVLQSDSRLMDRLTSLRYIFLAGEALPPAFVEWFRQLDPAGRIRLENIYGPTEATIYASYYSLSQWQGDRGIPIGKPLQNMCLYILDGNSRLQPIGVPGELIIGGAGVARGYLNHPELTAEKFVEDVFDPKNNSRLYKTGDLARWLPDGNMEFLGRIDQQVKIRGSRIELGEIETQLLKYDEIKEAVVVVKESTWEKSLFAYIVPGKKLSVSGLRKSLSAELPGYMIPSHFVELEKIPLNPNGKIDRKALMEMDKVIGGTEEYQPPRNLIQWLMTEAWQEVLEIERVSINDDFFEIGGHSLIAMRLISKLNEKQINVSLNELFRYPTIKVLSRYINDKSKENVHSIKSVEEAEDIFEREFNARGEFIAYHVENRNYRVFYVEDSLLERYEEIVKFFVDHFSPDLFPNFIRPVSRKPGAGTREMELSDSEFSSILKLETGIGEPNLVENFIEDLAKQLNRSSEKIQKNKTTKKYPLSAVQKVHLAYENPRTYNFIPLDFPLDIPLFEGAFLQLIESQGLLRSTMQEIDGRLTWNEFAPPARIKIPFFDLIQYDTRVKEEIVHKIIFSEIMTGFQETNALLYKPVLFRSDLKSYWLIISIFHTIYDNISGEIMERYLRNYYELKQSSREIAAGKPAPYSDYVEQMARGPQGIDENGLVEMFCLKEFWEYSREFEKNGRAKEQAEVDLLNYTVAFKEDVSAEEVWNLSFVIWILYLHRFLGLDRIPLRLLYHGRHYQQRYFFNTVGDFLDLIPVLVDIDAEVPIKMIKAAQEKVELATRYNVNFRSLVMNDDLKKKWEQAANFTAPRQGGRGDEWIVFNFEERKTEHEVMQGDVNPEIVKTLFVYCLNCEVHYMPRLSSINIFSRLKIDRDLVEEIFEKELEPICKKLNLELKIEKMHDNRGN
jgi:amino acid adenylation domain-containing protein